MNTEEEIPQNNNSELSRIIQSMLTLYDCAIVSFISVANSAGYDIEHNIQIPTLVLYGNDIIETVLRGKTFRKMLKRNPAEAFFYASRKILYCGIMIADKWYFFPDRVSQHFVSNIAGDSITNTVDQQLLLAVELCDNGNDTSGKYLLGSMLFSKMTDLQEPYWGFKHNLSYIFVLLSALYQLGITMYLNRKIGNSVNTTEEKSVYVSQPMLQ